MNPRPVAVRFPLAFGWLVLAVGACTDATTTTLSAPMLPARAQTGSAAARYKLRFIYDINPNGDGEITSDWFPDSGVILNVRAPWKSLSVTGATIDLVNFTHGDWVAGTCATFVTSKTIYATNWDIAATLPTRSFAGAWFGTFSTTQTAGTSVYFDGDRVIAGIVSPDSGGIHNLATNGNVSRETRDASGNNDWFQLELRNAALKFGSASSPDGLSNPVGVEVACANFTVLAKKTTLLGN